MIFLGLEEFWLKEYFMFFLEVYYLLDFKLILLFRYIMIIILFVGF